MPVKIETGEFEEDMLDMLFLDEPITEPLLSDDIWKKFELDFPEFSGIADIFFQEEQALFQDSSDDVEVHGCSFHNTSTSTSVVAGSPTSPSEIRNHDCMWAGHCGSIQHDEPRTTVIGCFIPPEPVSIRGSRPAHAHTHVKQEITIKEEPLSEEEQKQQQQANRSVLKPAVRAAVQQQQQQQQQQHMPQTPPMSDDEEAKVNSSKVLRLLTTDPPSPAVPGTEYSSDSELNEYLEEEEEEEEEEEDDEEEELEVESTNVTSATVELEAMRVKTAAESDHSYHKGKDYDVARLQESLGLETPSDSEEEIDVVNVVDKLSFSAVHHYHHNHNNRVTTSLPNNPSTRDKQQLQRRVATAIGRTASVNSGSPASRVVNSNGAISGGIKTILPVRKNAPTQQEVMAMTSPSKRKAAAAHTPTLQECHKTSGKRRPRKYKTGYSTPYKRRLYGNSSDSEPEPSEKRSLHNNMERQRRIDLRNAFEDLRLLIPEVCKRDRAAKVLILKEAAQYCDHLTKTSVNQLKHMEDLKRHQEWLRNRVSQLRRNLAAKR